MKKIVFCNICMSDRNSRVVYSSDDKSLPVSGKEVAYPICSFLEMTMKPDDEIKLVLLAKKDRRNVYEKNVERLKEDFEEANKNIGAKYEYVELYSDFEETKEVFETLMVQIVDLIDVGATILADITYGPKDLPIVLFGALDFAEKFLNCYVSNVIYGQVTFENGNVTTSKICDMSPLYCLNSVTRLIHTNDPEKARNFLRSLVSL